MTTCSAGTLFDGQRSCVHQDDVSCHDNEAATTVPEATPAKSMNNYVKLSNQFDRSVYNQYSENNINGKSFMFNDFCSDLDSRERFEIIDFSELPLGYLTEFPELQVEILPEPLLDTGKITVTTSLTECGEDCGFPADISGWLKVKWKIYTKAAYDDGSTSIFNNVLIFEGLGDEKEGVYCKVLEFGTPYVLEFVMVDKRLDPIYHRKSEPVVKEFVVVDPTVKFLLGLVF